MSSEKFNFTNDVVTSDNTNDFIKFFKDKEQKYEISTIYSLFGYIWYLFVVL